MTSQAGHQGMAGKGPRASKADLVPNPALGLCDHLYNGDNRVVGGV